MLDNTITLAVDTANTGVTEGQVYERYREYDNRSEYIGPGHSAASRNLLAFYTADPKQSGNYRGTRKSSKKLTEDIMVVGVDGNNIVSPIILEVSISAPIGATPAQMIEIRQRMIALLDNDTLCSKHELIGAI